MIILGSDYQPRPIRSLGLWQFEPGWHMKAYGIVYAGDKARDTPGPALLQAARQLAETRLLDAANRTNHYGIGFIGIYRGKSANFIFIDWWAAENELHHHVYVSTTEHPTQFEYLTPTGLTACAWDLQVVSFERHAWPTCLIRGHDSAHLTTSDE